MAFFTIPNIRFAGVSACVPKNILSNHDYKWIADKERQQLINAIGIETKRAAIKGTATSDLCFTAAQKLIEDLNWDKNEIELLVFVSQSRDYVIPSTSCILQDRLGLSKNCVAFDLGMGCSGYVYGLSIVASMLTSGQIKKALLLVGDISTLNASYRDKSTYPLFGDAGTATALEYQPNAAPIAFNLQTDGSGYKAIMVEHGGFRKPLTKKSLDYKQYGKGIIRNKIQVSLNGIDVFNFSLREITPNVNYLLGQVGKTVDNFDYFLFHQANKLINETVRKKLRLPKEKVPYSLKDFGNTSSASIPLTMVYAINDQLKNQSLNLMLTGFGVGLSWGSVALETNQIVCPEIIEY